MNSRLEELAALAGFMLITVICWEDLVLSIYELVEFGRLLLN